MSFICETPIMYPRKMITRTTPSMRLRTTALSIHRSKKPPISVGSRKNSTTENPTPSTIESVTTAFSSFSEPNFPSNHFSNLLGSAFSSSGKKSAEYISAFTPPYIEEPKLTTPRISGQVIQPLFFFSGSTFSTSPSGLRTTMARFSGPCIRMPSIRACPPIIVLNFSLLCASRRTSFCSAMITSILPPSGA